MPLKTKPETVQEVLERMTLELTAFVCDEMQRRVLEAIGEGGTLAPRLRLAPADREVAVPPKKPAVVETRRAVPVKARQAAIEKSPVAESASGRIDRTPPSKEPRTLDMTCRVEGCGKRSRGPRMGFICDAHRALLSPEQQRRAREDYKSRGMRRETVSAEPSIAVASAQPDAGRSDALAPALARSELPPEPVDLPSGGGVAAAGSDYALTIVRARVVTPPKLGPTVELKFTVARGPQLGRVARGRFPLAGRGLTV